MRALCGAIITAGALIGLGLTALGFGIRFEAAIDPATHHPVMYDSAVKGVAWGATSMTICLVVLLISVGIGLATAFIGLMYHHERRHREHTRELGHTTTGAHATV
jgi:hypothetical protein